jgi:type III restriction enzyme
MRKAKLDPNQEEMPLQPVERPILCGPYDEPTEYWYYNRETHQHDKIPGRRPASYYYNDKGTSGSTGSLFAQENEDVLIYVNKLREDVRRWREAKYENATNITKELLAHWRNPERHRRFFFCQIEAVETILYLNEIRGLQPNSTRRKPRFTPKFEDADFGMLTDVPNEADRKPLTRYGCKMATGSGKTVVMAMLTAWAFCNRGQVTSDERFPRAALICCPNLTVKERLGVLVPGSPGNYYELFDIVPSRLRPLLHKGKVIVTNWHAFAPESEHSENGKTYAVVNKGQQSDEAFAKTILKELYDLGPLMVLNDEAHHAYRPAPVIDALTPEEKAEREEATVWITGLDRFNSACGVRFCVDLSATPFYLHGSGYTEGAPFRWLVSDFGLVDAIESGIVKIPRLPVADNTGHPDPQYFNLWRHIVDSLPAGQKLSKGKPKPDVLWSKAEPALRTLAGQWRERFRYVQEANDNQDKVPPVLILVCDNTDIAEFFYRKLSGETEEPITQSPPDEEAEDEEGEEASTKPKKSAKPKTRTVYSGNSAILPEFANASGIRRTLRIDSKLLAVAESDTPNATQKDAALELRRVVSTVGKVGEPGEQVRCVVSVSMLTEGWDANNVTQIFGLRAFGSQLLCEQVVGRGLRRMDYTVGKDGKLTEEYVDVYGIPFSLIPFKGRAVDKPQPIDKPKNHVKAIPERAAFEIKFPVVEGYAFALQRNQITVDESKLHMLGLEPNLEPIAVFVKPTVAYAAGSLSISGPGELAKQDRKQFYAETHFQSIEFAVAKDIVDRLLTDAPGRPVKTWAKYHSRHQLFPQVARIVHRYLQTHYNFNGVDPRELGLERYKSQVIELIYNFIEPVDNDGEPALLPILNSYEPFGSTTNVDFKTTRECRGTLKSHINQVVLDNRTWEAAAALQLEASSDVICYARNDQMNFQIPYEENGLAHHYTPDFIVKLIDGRLLILEVKGFYDNEEVLKWQATERWCNAVNRCDKLGRWLFHVCRDPQTLKQEIALMCH